MSSWPPPAFEPEPTRVPAPAPATALRGRKTLRGRISGILAALVALGAKFATALKAALLLLPKAKLFTTAGTALVSVAAYSLFWGWTFAVGLVVLLFVHEMGHVIALRREGIRASAPMFVPFMGALITARSLGGDAAAEARVGLAGPILGSIGAAVPALVYAITGTLYWENLAYVGFFLNLFNLIPVVPLDGGRAIAAMSPRIWLVGLGVLAFVAFRFPSPFLLIILVLGVLETYRRYRQQRNASPEQASYYQVRTRDRVLIGLTYLALVVLLGIGAHATYAPRSL